MDIISHGLYGALLARSIKKKSSLWLAFFVGMMPDLLSFGPHFVASFIFQDENLFNIPPYVHTLYNFTHSLIIALIVLGLLWYLKKFRVEFLAWPLHILCDIPTHAKDFFPTPFLWPLSNFHVDGIRWSDPHFLIFNYSAIFAFALILLILKRIDYKFFLGAVATLLLLSNFLIFRKPITIEYQLEGKDYTLLTAKAIWEKTKGLSGIQPDQRGAFDGMIFYFDPPEQAMFWNKDTHLNLELYWIKNGQVLRKDFLPSIDSAGLTTITAPQEIDQVIEIIQ